MILIGNALGYRMESYLCAPTVTHVVRILQANKTNSLKYKTSWPDVLCGEEQKSNNEAYCSLGKYAYILSIMEQFGYIYRFYKEYCEEGEHYDAIKCEKKKKKYMERLIDAAINMLKRLDKKHSIEKEIQEQIQRRTQEQIQGGKRRKMKTIRRNKKNKQRNKRKTNKK
jgi:hypothetical protein